MATVGMLNRSVPAAMVRALTKDVRRAVSVQVKAEAEALALKVEAVTPVRTGTMRMTVRVEPGSDDTSWIVIVGAVPETRKKVRVGVTAADFARANRSGGFKGEYDYPLGVEFGHKTVDGQHVAAEPFLFPTYRSERSGMRRRVRGSALTVVRKYDLDKSRGSY